MPQFFFNLKHLSGVVVDPDGANFPDVESARAHATTTVHELMKNREATTRSWRLDVCDSERLTLFGIAFADEDRSLDHLSPPLRASLNEVRCETIRLLDNVQETRTMLLRIMAVLARSSGKPWLAAVDGTRI